MNDFSTPQEVQHLLTNVRCPWGVAGGWALDLFLNRVTRKDKDIEVAIFREDQLILQEYLSAQGGFFEYVCNGQLFPWKSEERLELPIHEIRCRISSGSLRCLSDIRHLQDLKPLLKGDFSNLHCNPTWLLFTRIRGFEPLIN
jgi:hypothetical protein